MKGQICQDKAYLLLAATVLEIDTLKDRILASMSTKPVEHHPCRLCGMLIEMKGRSRFCSKECYDVFYRHYYLFMNEEQKSKHKEATYRWQREHPDRYKVINQSACRCYSSKVRKMRRGSNINCVICGGSLLRTGRRKYCFGCLPVGYHRIRKRGNLSTS